LPARRRWSQIQHARKKDKAVQIKAVPAAQMIGQPGGAKRRSFRRRDICESHVRAACPERMNSPTNRGPHPRRKIGRPFHPGRALKPVRWVDEHKSLESRMEYSLSTSANAARLRAIVFILARRVRAHRGASQTEAEPGPPLKQKSRGARLVGDAGRVTPRRRRGARGAIRFQDREHPVSAV